MATNIFRVTIQGTAPNGEVWSINPCYQFGDFPIDDPTFSEMNAAAAAVGAISPGVNLLGTLSTNYAITGVRIEARTYSGALNVVGEYVRPTPISGTGTATKPFQTCVVFSLRTARPGGSGRGRLYWPAAGATMTSATQRWDATQRGLCLTGMVAYLQAIGDAMEAPLGLAGSGLMVWSRTLATATPVNELQTGDIFDTQRRRRDAVAENYVAAPY